MKRVITYTIAVIMAIIIVAGFARWWHDDLFSEAARLRGELEALQAFEAALHALEATECRYEVEIDCSEELVIEDDSETECGWQAESSEPIAEDEITVISEHDLVLLQDMVNLIFIQAITSPVIMMHAFVSGGMAFVPGAPLDAVLANEEINIFILYWIISAMIELDAHKEVLGAFEAILSASFDVLELLSEFFYSPLLFLLDGGSETINDRFADVQDAIDALRDLVPELDIISGEDFFEEYSERRLEILVRNGLLQ